ncbi:MAG: alpha/beta fold hydrolase [Anaerolineaceae bacterium]
MTEQQIRFCKNADGVRIAYSTMGSGPPLVLVSGWVSHLEDDIAPDFFARDGIMALAQQFALIRYDKGGTGLSDRNLGHYTLDSRLADLEAVVSSLKLKKFSLLAISEGGPIAIAYAARHPKQVDRLVLWGTYARGPSLSKPEMREALLSVVRASWGVGSDMMTNLFMPGASVEEARTFALHQRRGATKEDAAALLEAVYESDVSDLLARVSCPTLVIHSRSDKAISYRHGLEVASGIPGARLVSLEGRGHLPEPEVMGDSFRQAADFILEGTRPPPPSGASAGKRPDAAQGLLTIMFTDLRDSTALTQRLGDARAQQELVHRHNEAVREALTAHGGREVKHTGDGIMASFGSGSGAIDAALDIQDTFGGDDAFQVRIGLNAGEPVAEDGDLFGATVQLAARVCSRAEPGEILVTNVVRELSMGKGFLFSEQMPAALKGFEEPVRLFAVHRGQ